MIYLIGNTKGGVGKTTIAVHLAAWLAHQGHRTLLIDADKQASAASWASWRRGQTVAHTPKTVMLKKSAVFDEGKAFAADYDDLVIDAGGEDNPGLRYGMLLADRLIVPVTHSNFSTAAWDDMQAIIESARINNPRLTVRVLINRVHSARKDRIDLESFFAERDYPLLDTRIPELAAFVYATDEGLAVFERKSFGAAVAERIHQLCKEITHG